MSFPRYPKYKASGVEWLGEVPEHWEVRATKRLFRILGGGTPASEVPDYWDGDIAWATPADLGKITGLELSTTQRRITAAGRDSCNTTVVPTGSILLSTRAPIGSVALAGAPICTNQGCKSLIPSVDAYSRFYAYTLLACTVPLQLRGKGTTFLELSGEELGAFPLVLPPLAEQRAIAAFLDRETKKIDELVAAQERLIELLKEKRQAVISHAVTKGLDPAAPMKPSGVEWLGDVPAHWEVRRLRGLFRQTKRQDQDAKPVLSVYRDLGVVLKDSRDDNNNKTPEDLSLYQLVQPGDLVVNKMKAWQGSLGISSIEGITSPDYAVFVSRHTEEDAFLHLLLRSAAMVSQYLRISNGIRLDQWRLETDLFLNMEVFLPSPDEQRSIAENLGVKLRQVDELVAQAESAIALLTERRSALISAAVTGQVDVRNAVPEVSA